MLLRGLADGFQDIIVLDDIVVGLRRGDVAGHPAVVGPEAAAVRDALVLVGLRVAGVDLVPLNLR